MSLEEIEKKYVSLWVAVKVTERDDDGQPKRGFVLCQHLNRKMLSHELTYCAEKDICIFRALPERKGFVVMI